MTELSKNRPNIQKFQEDNAERNELRFSFGGNWSNYLETVDQSAMDEARDSIVKVLGRADLRGLSFLDVGCGSGLFSMAAKSLGATVLSFDFDAESVRCAEILKNKYFPDDCNWVIRQGSILDSAFVERLGVFDVVYAWGVLHHTGNLWRALENASSCVRSDGKFVIAIYNDQGYRSKIWLFIKQVYNKLPPILRNPYVFTVMFPREFRSLAFSTITLQPLRYFRLWTDYQQKRGMSKWHDLVDWVGGLPFEVARPEQVIFFLRDRGFELIGLTTCGGEIGCNEFVLRRTSINVERMPSMSNKK